MTLALGEIIRVGDVTVAAVAMRHVFARAVGPSTLAIAGEVAPVAILIRSGGRISVLGSGDPLASFGTEQVLREHLADFDARSRD
ncbi:MAG: hypothetical protein AAFR94_00450 [Pseudomonadota bacterium]